MGHRANFVVIRDGRATAHYDQWAAMGCTHFLADGPDAACREISSYEQVDELMDWAFAEAGYLLDFDEKTAILFGCAFGLDELGESDEDVDSPTGEAGSPFEEGGLALLRHIAPNWSGWTLVWDDHGVDAFAAHLRRRSIEGIAVQPDSHPPDTADAIEYRA